VRRFTLITDTLWPAGSKAQPTTHIVLLKSLPVAPDVERRATLITFVPPGLISRCTILRIRYCHEYKRKLVNGRCQYDFCANPTTSCHLDLGQQVSLCCLDNDITVAKGRLFFVYSPEVPGYQVSFSILAPNNRSPPPGTVGPTQPICTRLENKNMKVGVRVPFDGYRRLAYRGRALTRDGMVYIAEPESCRLVDQVRAVLPNGSRAVSRVARSCGSMVRPGL
jgi:hypothetical protein